MLEKRVKYYLEGMPDEKTGMVFPPRCNMEDKLNELEREREFLVCEKFGMHTINRATIVRYNNKHANI